MRNNTFLSGFCCSALFVGIVAQHTLPRLPFAHPTPLPVMSFPTKVGDWTAGKNLPQDPDVMKILSTATIMSRNYKNKAGQEINLTLITGTEYSDFHSPLACFPAHGFALSNQVTWPLYGQSVHFMTASLEGNSEDFCYFIPGGMALGGVMGGSASHLLALSSLVTGHEGGSVVVRLTTADNPGSQDLIKRFIGLIMPDINQLIAEGKKKK